ncbi:MAG: hypothetical protein DRG78_05135 [Epsilonproteobacteria bacterium]|nr:MAG: hypothetical protein DRG78_05135 [Campylobacterota bacterium]
MKTLILKIEDLDKRNFETVVTFELSDVYTILAMNYKSERIFKEEKILVMRNGQKIKIIDTNNNRNLCLQITYSELSEKISYIIDNSTSDIEELKIK